MLLNFLHLDLTLPPCRRLRQPHITSAFFFFLRMYQTVDLTTPNVPAISQMDFLFLFLKPNNSLFHLYESSFDCMMWVHSNSFQMQIRITLRINSRPYTCLIDVKITKE